LKEDPPDLDPTELSPTETADTSTAAEKRMIGPYRLLQKVGEGGMGEVWLAEQSEPVKRRVALKVIKQGMDTKQVVARFEAERQALALMDHPTVAKVFDAGATPEGRPYFAMEYVEGVPITEHCDRHRLATRERLRLFRQVCEGVQHAHQKAIIHRDLKPSNVLVSIREGNAVPKIIDFGVAKATAQKLTEKTMFTELGVLIGTPEYMSPEQAEMTGQDVDTRTDVYALGVMLYELLVGALPFDSKALRKAGFDGIRRKIREEEPPRPSTRLSTLGDRSTESAKLRQVDIPTLQRQLRGDLDWITMKALEKDRTRRYGSPFELAADIERHLNHEPVLASPPSAAYRTRKFVRRHRFGVGVGIAAALLLLAFSVTMTVQARRIATERDRANREREMSDRVSAFMADMLSDMNPHTLGTALWSDLRERVAEARGSQGAPEEEIEAVLSSLGDLLYGTNPTDAALRLVHEQILSPAATLIERELADQPRLAGRLEHTLGVTYYKLGLFDQAERHMRRAVEIRTQELGDEHQDTLSSMSWLAWFGHMLERSSGEEQFREILGMQRDLLGEEHPDTLLTMFYLAAAYFKQRRFEESEVLHRDTLELRRRVLGGEHPDTLTSMRALANTYSQTGRHEEAVELQARTLEIRHRVLGEDHSDTFMSISNLGHAYLAAGRYVEAEEQYQEVLEARRRVLGKAHPATVASMESLAYAWARQGRYAKAEILYRDVLAAQRRVLGDSHPDTLASERLLARLAEQVADANAE
jgi:non-specific serine/threonine protein kinase/serine/threonine-protein kinase